MRSRSRLIGERRAGHGRPRSRARSARRSCGLRFWRTSSYGPQTNRWSHQVQPRSTGGGGKEARAERSVQDLHHRPGRRAPVVVERDHAVFVAAGGDAVVEPPRLDRLGEELLARERVEDRLQDLPAADDYVGGRTRLAGLVVGDAKRAARVTLDEVDRAAQLQVAEHRDRRRDARRVGFAALAERQAERELEAIGDPAVLVLGRAPQPLAQVGANAVDAVLPHPRDRRAELIAIARRDHRRGCRRRGRGPRVTFSSRTGNKPSARRRDSTANCTSWKSEPRVSGSIVSIAIGSSRGFRRCTAWRKKR